MDTLSRCFQRWKLASLDQPTRRDVSPSVIVSSLDCSLSGSAARGRDSGPGSSDSGISRRLSSAYSHPTLTDLSDADISLFVERLRRQVIGEGDGEDEHDDHLHHYPVASTEYRASSRRSRHRKHATDVGSRRATRHSRSRQNLPERKSDCSEACNSTPIVKSRGFTAFKSSTSSPSKSSSSSLMDSAFLCTSSVSCVDQPADTVSPQSPGNTALYSTPLLTYPLQVSDGGAALVSSATTTTESDTPHLHRFLQTRHVHAPPPSVPPQPSWQLELVQRAVDRRQRCRQRQEQRLEEQERVRQERRQQEKQQLQLRQQQNRQRLRELEERKVREQLRRKSRADVALLSQRKFDQAVQLHHFLLMRSAFAALRHNVQVCQVNRHRALTFDRARRQRCVIRQWRSHCHLAAERRNNMAHHWYHRQLLFSSLTRWKLVVRQQMVKHQAACDFHCLHLTHVVFSAWKRLYCIRQQEVQRQLHLAAKFHTRLIRRRALRRWRHLPDVLRTEREIEARRNRLRRIVREIIPDFTPPPVSHHLDRSHSSVSVSVTD